ncbi:hypothetical protein [Bacillus piscicola]|uniref:hypothetical protein n=1 Tax=Bacillus piscicola TaxID=1632684 RepID=UPI001F09291B|nr:hypothetical protein [Bacillus piscicola]
MRLLIFQLILFIHIFLGITWVGGVMFVGWGVFPAISSLTFSEQRNVLATVMKKAHPLFILAGIGVIVSGLVLGTILGPLHQWGDIWNTLYGKRWAVAFITASLSLIWGASISFKSMMAVLANNTLWQLADKGITTPLNRSLRFAKFLASFEVAGFIVVIMVMVLL